jgi:lipopolysaccharide/colanic/teichoic acid biosynthesis glycosyltransferase
MSSISATTASPGFQYVKEGRIWSVIQSLERLASLVTLILLMPLGAPLAVAIAVLSRRSPLVGHLRIGQYGAPFWTLKFRTMWPGGRRGGFRFEFMERIIDECGPEYKRSADPRVTSAFARFCRRHSIDELPQLVNVLCGEMSLAAPRPLTEGELYKYYGHDAAEILLVKPGITGLWQVMGRSRLTYEQRREMDLYLVRNRSLKLYFTILWRTIPAVLKGKDGW